jgi:hypothetical protein
MKCLERLFIVVLLSLVISGCSGDMEQSDYSHEGQVEIVVSPAIDLFDLISRLANINQYMEGLLPEYFEDLENTFEPFRDHPSIEFARECNIMNQINGDAPMALAVYVGPPPELELRMDLSNIPAVFDPRWDSALISKYLEHARVFATDSKYIDFHNSKSDIHDQASRRLKKMLDEEGLFHWYKEFFGYYPARFKMYLSLHNGSCSYGYPVFYPNGEEEFVSLIGGRFPDKNGIPKYPSEWFMPIIIHEYMHSYINPLIKGRPDEFMELGEVLLETHRVKMIERAYNVWNVMLQEYIVRACTLRYLEWAKGEKIASKRILYDVERGFPEIKGLVELLAEYELDRHAYPDFNAFLPHIKAYFKNCLLNP